MKYGEKLQQRSIPAWSAYNIDYDDVKHFIKKRTTNFTNSPEQPGVRRLNDARLQQTEDELFAILDEQHRRIDLFVKSKAREIQHRLNDAKKRLRQLAARQSLADVELSARRLERYSRLENEVLKAGEEIKSLARFTGAQRTAFGKLLKKYKKWSGSLQLEDRFREQILSDPKSFTNHDLGPLLDEYSETLHNIRALYASRLRRATNEVEEPGPASYLIGSSIVGQLLTSIAMKQKVDFDTAIATVPLGEDGKHATYFVHPENIVELQVLLMQHMNFHMSRSRQNSRNGPISSRGAMDEVAVLPTIVEHSDYFWLGADEPGRFAQEQEALDTRDHEARAGSTPQRSRFSARWNTSEEDDALIAARVGETHMQVSRLRRKHIDAFFQKDSVFPPRRASVSVSKHSEELSTIRSPYMHDEQVRPLYLMSSHRTRFLGLNNTPKHVLLATLDTGISLGSWSDRTETTKKTKFPYAVLIVRQEGLVSAQGSLIDSLDQSHLVERLQGFSMEHHAIWQVCGPDSIAKPFWASMLTHDIRKLPPPALKHSDTTATTSTTLLGSSQGLTSSTASVSALSVPTDSATAVDTNGGSSSNLTSDLEQSSGLQAVRKKRRRAFPQQAIAPAERYWSEYDHPEDGEDGGDAYVIYIDPDEKSTLDRMFESITGWFSRKSRRNDEERPLVPSATPKEDESSSDDDTGGPSRQNRSLNYGTVLRQRQASSAQYVKQQLHIPFLPQPTVACLAAAAVILVVGYVLAATGRHKQGAEVEAGVLFAFGSSVLFLIAGVIMLARAKLVQQFGVALAVATVLLESVAAGGLLAHTIG